MILEYQCDKQFTEQGCLKRHIESIHEGVKYPCNQCDKQFTEQGNLTKHVQAKHEGVKYACNQCDKQFTHQSKVCPLPTLMKITLVDLN